MNLRTLFLLAVCVFVPTAQADVPPELLAVLEGGERAQEFKATSLGRRGSTHETEIAWTSSGQDARAWLLVPQNATKAPLTVYLHGENPVPQPRMFVDEAISLAANGIASLHVSLPLARAATAGADDDMPLRQSVKRVQEVLGWVRQQKHIDGERVVVVGQRYGAMVATVIAAVDDKVDGLALLAPPGKPSGWLQVSDRPAAQKLRATFDKEKWGPYLFGLAKYDTEVWLPYAKHARTLLQFSSQDDWTTTLEQVELFRAAKGTKERKSYEADSRLNTEARGDRMNWIKKVLGP
jgi:acetyl esterase/lipase